MIGFVGHAISYLFADHHLVARHVVVHHVFKRGLVGLQIYQVKVDEVIRGHLHSICVLDVVDGTADFYGFVDLPVGFMSD